MTRFIAIWFFSFPFFFFPFGDGLSKRTFWMLTLSCNALHHEGRNVPSAHFDVLFTTAGMMVSTWCRW